MGRYGGGFCQRLDRAIARCYQLNMGQILLRNVDDTLIDTLKQRASLAGRSMEAEAREALRRGLRLTAEERGALSLRLRAMTPKNVVQTDSTLLIREDRDSR